MLTFEWMRKFFAICFIGVHLFTTTELVELMKLPLLVEHYFEHRSQDIGVTLLDFLSMHYANGENHDADYDKDQRLPFKSHEGCVNLMVLNCLPHLHQPYLSLPVALSSDLPEGNMQIKPDTDFHASIWQPPRS